MFLHKKKWIWKTTPAHNQTKYTRSKFKKNGLNAMKFDSLHDICTHYRNWLLNCQFFTSFRAVFFCPLFLIIRWCSALMYQGVGKNIESVQIRFISATISKKEVAVQLGLNPNSGSRAEALRTRLFTPAFLQRLGLTREEYDRIRVFPVAESQMIRDVLQRSATKLDW